jgi:type VI secretion system protein ImpE
MSASELYKSGRLQEAIDAQIQEVKSHPADQGKRLFLFELLAFAGDLDRARRQIEAVRYDDVQLEAATATYRTLLDAEQKRRRVFAEGISPQFLAEPPAHVKQRLEALNELRAGKLQDAARLLNEADQAAPVPRGQLNDKEFTALRDCDDVFGTVLEVLAHGEYYWVPLEQVQLLAMNPPRFPRDLLWVPARLQMTANAGDVFLPALYPGSHEQSDEAVKLGRATDWKAEQGGPVLGVGLRQFLVDDDAVSILEIRTLQIE